MRLRIVSDGTGRGTSVTNAETGEAIEGVVSCSFSIEAGDDAVVMVTLRRVEVDVAGRRWPDRPRPIRPNPVAPETHG